MYCLHRNECTDSERQTCLQNLHGASSFQYPGDRQWLASSRGYRAYENEYCLCGRHLGSIARFLMEANSLMSVAGRHRTVARPSRRGSLVGAAANVLCTCQVSPTVLCGVGTRCIVNSQMWNLWSRGDRVMQLYGKLFKLHASS